jgi:hypothetical protein
MPVLGETAGRTAICAATIARKSYNLLVPQGISGTARLTQSLANKTAMASIKAEAGLFEHWTCAIVGAGAAAKSSGCY